MAALVPNAFGQDRSSSSSSKSDSLYLCTADARWANTNGQLSYSKQIQVPVSMTLLTAISKANDCAKNGEIRVNATFLTESQDYICSGTISKAMTISSEVQNFNIEIRPFTQNEFFRWRNQPGARGIQQGLELKCSNLDGSADVGDLERSKAGWVHLTVAVLPANGGLAVLNALIRVAP